MARISKVQRLWLAGFFAAAGYVLDKVSADRVLTIVFLLAATILAGVPIFLKAVRAIRYKVVGIDALVTIAVGGALVIGEYWEAAAVTYLFMLGDYLEARTIEKTRSSIKALLDLAPVTARVRRDGAELSVAPEAVLAGDQVVVKPGEKIAVDGLVLEGSGYVGQAAITGEAIPVSRNPGETVFSGTILESGYLIIRADKVGDDTTFARILHLVEDAQDKKARTQQFLDKFSRFYTPAIIVLAVILYLTTRDLVLALTLLVIACPGALVISAPVSIVAGIGNGARHGVLIKGGDIMEQLGGIRAIAFDKTGTLTIGRPAVRQVRAYGLEADELLRLAAIGESYSEHPLARAVIAEAEKRLGPIRQKPEETAIHPGQGLVYTWEGRLYRLGNRKLFENSGVDLAAHEADIRDMEDQGWTVILLGSGQTLIGLLAIADQIRPEARGLIAALKRQGVRHVFMLTGDNQRAARAIADELGLDGFYAELLPEDKVRVLAEIQDRCGRAAMVGDGGQRRAGAGGGGSGHRHRRRRQ